MSGTVLVAIPYFRCADWIDDAVRAALAQTYRDVVVLVAGDGDEPEVSVRDDRLVVVSFPTNEGAPATQQAMLEGSPFLWYAPHGADDWTDPEYVERLVALGGHANGSAALFHERADGTVIVRDHDHVEFGVFDATLLRSIGGYGIDQRCGQDTLLYVDLLPNVTGLRWAEEPAYHKRIRPGSLTQDPATGFNSPYRTNVVWHNRDVKEHCAAIGWENRTDIRRYRSSLATPAQREVLGERIETVRAALA